MWPCLLCSRSGKSSCGVAGVCHLWLRERTGINWTSGTHCEQQNESSFARLKHRMLMSIAIWCHIQPQKGGPAAVLNWVSVEVIKLINIIWKIIWIKKLLHVSVTNRFSEKLWKQILRTVKKLDDWQQDQQMALSTWLWVIIKWMGQAVQVAGAGVADPGMQ